MRIVGIDPGYAICGFGVVEYDGRNLEVVDYGTFSTPSGTPFHERLLIIHRGMEQLLATYKPDVMAVEELFFSRNTTTAMGTSQARGVIILAGALHKIPIYEYKPIQVKKAVSGYGKADKKQVQLMVKNLLSLTEIPEPDDAADALAIAICQAFTGPRPDFKLKGAYNYDFSHLDNFN